MDVELELDPDLLRRIDHFAGERGREAWIADAVRTALDKNEAQDHE